MRIASTALAHGVFSALLLAATAVAGSPAEEVAAVQARLQAALDARDAKLLAPLIAEPFIWVHASDGRVDDRAAWLESAARGMALSGQRHRRTEHGATVQWHGEPAHTAVRVARVRIVFEDAARESWIRQTHTWVRSGAGWQLAMGQGVVMYDGPTLATVSQARYAGDYSLEDGRRLALVWEDDTLLARFPNGAQTQIFLASATEEVVRNPAAGSLRFTLGEDGAPRAVSLVRHGREVWRATRR